MIEPIKPIHWTAAKLVLKFLLDRRKQYADATDALHVEKRSEANNQEDT